MDNNAFSMLNQNLESNSLGLDKQTLQSILRESGLTTAQEISNNMGIDLAEAQLWLACLGSTSQNKYMNYRKMKSEWRLNSQLNRSKIQGLGLYAKRDIEPGTFIIEYTGELIRKDLAESRELYYDKIGKGTYMFRLTDDFIIDATLIGGAARYINHNCDPNCKAENIEIDGKHHIIIVSNRYIMTGEELSYDYNFDVEDDKDDKTERVACLCGASNCRKWMN